MKYAMDPEMFKKVFSAFKEGNPMWDEIPTSSGAQPSQWDPNSTYSPTPTLLRRFHDGTRQGSRHQERSHALAVFGD